ncbi:MAG: PQQ-dependent sugar dehydrogenase [Alphaproteobacteria bacterium]|nr:PQQ-dependent sugar dehydrogenase [Alphaproteobacteria bacterium]MBU0794166.1 PQQ-dependent sugar dehydrogenase [Alphaproteobacteria bacterium]MBU0876691.1 PQQ-dependent sugar dehydrogenase [Alphaproteobacteria bacterium]MBU1769393.1 PQQ-dependent sugar dehydrogenase [Alphaproteobacteria bacterium]
MKRFGGKAVLLMRAAMVAPAAIALLSTAGLAADVPEVSVPAELPGPGPYMMRSAEQAAVKVEIVAQGLEHLYSLAFLPDGDALIVERGVRLRLLRQATGPKPVLEPQPIANVPDYTNAAHLKPIDVMGIQDVLPDPDFATNRLIYFTFNRPVGYDPAAERITATTVLARARLDGLRLTEVKDLLVGEAMVGTGGSRILIDANRQLFVAVGALSEGDVQSAQRTDNIYGKVLRIGIDGHVPEDNPFARTKGARPEIWTYGHRDPLGLAIDPRSGRLVASEHGPQGGDELNELLPGRNYGWPNSTYGTEYAGSRLPIAPVAEGTEGPLLIWSPAIAPNGIAFYTGSVMPGWSNNLFVTSARRGQINGTGALIRLVFNDGLEEMRQEVLLDGLHQRFKDVQQGPDGLLYAVTDEANSIVVRIGPGNEPARTEADNTP